MSPASKAKRKFSLDCPASDMPRNPIKAECWQVSHGISRMVGNAEDKAPFAGALQLITTSLDYDLGAFWVVNDLRMTLDCAEYFSRSPETFPQFETVTRSRHFSIGEGLPGTVWSTREVLHIPDVTCAENFPRFSIAKQEGLRNCRCVLAKQFDYSEHSLAGVERETDPRSQAVLFFDFQFPNR